MLGNFQGLFIHNVSLRIKDNRLFMMACQYWKQSSSKVETFGLSLLFVKGRQCSQPSQLFQKLENPANACRMV